jgi:poly(A) polymerase
MHRRFATACCAALLATAPVAGAHAQDAGFAVSYTAGQPDASSRFMGGTELRNLLGHRGALYAGNGYWMDRPGPEGRQPAQLLRLDQSMGSWRVERNFDEALPNHAYRHLAVSALLGTTFANGVSLLLVGTWDLSGSSEVFVRNDATGAWSASPLPVGRVRSGIQQVRALTFHRDRQTGVDLVFAGNDRFGIFSGAYDAAAAGQIRWSAAAELDVPGLAMPSSPGLSLPRVASFTECDGILHATVGQQIYRRVDGAAPRWQLLYTNPKPGHSETGLRGLTAVAKSSGQGQALMVAVEGTAVRILRIDPSTGRDETELDLQAFVGRSWGTTVGYLISAYNDMTVLPDGTVLIGLEAFLPAKSPVPTGHARVDGLDGGGWYLVRRGEGRYDLRRIGSVHPLTGRPLIATRTIAQSPFSQAPDLLYFGGYDANKLPAHDTAWIFRAERAAAVK